jgi:hypothetical protein
MLREAIFLFACWVCVFGYQTRMIYSPPREAAAFTISPSVTEESLPPPDLTLSGVTLNDSLLTTSLAAIGRHEDYVSIDRYPGTNKEIQEKRSLKKRVENLPVRPDIIVKELALTEDFDLSIVLSNAGDGELRKGTTLCIRIFMNDQRVSEFDHFIFEPLRPYSENRYIIDPPHRIKVSGNSRVKVLIWPKQLTGDIQFEQNTLERTFTIFPFKIDPEVTREFPLLLSDLRSKKNRQGDKIRTEVRWDGGGGPLRLSLRGARHPKKIGPVSGKSPLKLEIPIGDHKKQEGKAWRLSIANLTKKKAEGFLIIQGP